MVRIADLAKVTGFWKQCYAFVFQDQVFDPDDKDTGVFKTSVPASRHDVISPKS